tara:strand:- start:8721 stop:12548 length:3828 start_codon:yes stop_codon:yes gene_type:complete
MPRYNYYKTLQEASDAAIALGINSPSEYSERHKEDSKLPGTPRVKYKDLGWDGWEVFFGREKQVHYDTYQEAADATMALGINRHSEYVARYKEDPKLHASPEVKYKDLGWDGWTAFFGREKKVSYETYQEAVDATMALGINNPSEYNERYKEDPKLHANPWIKYKDLGWDSWTAFLGREKKVFYETYQEAVDATMALDINNPSEYNERYKEDPKLPSIPHIKYKDLGWDGWDAFFGKEDLYETLQKASDATTELGINAKYEYLERYKEDPKLPSNPRIKYKNLGWDGWDSFFGKVGKYYSYLEVVRYIAATDVQVRTIADYLNLTKGQSRFPHQPTQNVWKEYHDWASLVGIEYIDPLDAIGLIQTKGNSVTDLEGYLNLRELYRSLPINPLTTYKFDSFEEFINFSEDKLWGVEQVRAYCHEHRISTNNEYKNATKTNPYLAIDKAKIAGFSSFANIAYSTDFDMLDTKALKAWHDTANAWIDSVKKIGTKISTLRNYFAFNLDNLTSSPARYCEVENKPDINVWLNALSPSSKNVATVNIIAEFFDFVLLKHCAHVSEETGETVYLEGYSNPIQPKDIQVELNGYVQLSESNKGAIPFRYIDRARKYLVPEGDTVTNFKELFNSIDAKTEMYSNFSEWFDVDENIIDKNDPNCVWKCSKGQFQMWSPVRLIALYTQLFMPFRGSQVCWLDSGEAESHLLVKKDGKLQWEKNSLLIEHRVPHKNWQGFLKSNDLLTHTDTNNKISVGCHVNTNKTAKKAYDGYDIPWVDDRIIPWIIMLRDWQTRYNPLTEPTNWSNEFKSGGKTTEGQLKRYGHNSRTCFLFRDPTMGGIRPLTQAKLSAAFAGLTYLIQDKELPLAVVKGGVYSDKKMTSIKSLYTLHSMRVSLITAFIRDARIAPEIVQKLVGHSSLVMTIYYTKVTSVDIQEQLQNSDSRIIKNQAKRVEQLIKQKKMEQARSELIGADGELVKAKWDMPASAFSFMDSGICPNGRTLCHNGGQPIDKDKSIYTAVTHGYLGSSNCIQCRHFVTGPAFLGGLQMLTNEIALECKAGAFEVESLRTKIEVMEDEEYRATMAGEPFLKQHELSLSESHYEQEATRFDGMTCDLISIVRLSMNSIALLNRKIKGNKKTDGLSLVTSSSQDEVVFQLGEASDFMQLDMVCHSASYYQSSHPKNANLQRQQYIDLFAKKNGLSPGMFMLDERQQLEVGNELTKFVHARTGSWDKVNQLMNKEEHITLKELGFDDDETQQGLTLLLEGKPLNNNILSNKESKLKVL